MKKVWKFSYSLYCTMMELLLYLPQLSVSRRTYRLLTQPKACEEVVEHADDGVGALSLADSLTDHLAKDGLSAYSENRTFPWFNVTKYIGLGLLGLVLGD